VIRTRSRSTITLGLGFFLGGLLRYHSETHAPVLGRWSYPFFAVIVAAMCAWLAALIWTWRAARTPPPPVRRPAADLLGLGVLIWGVAYFVAAMDTPAAGGKVLDGQFFGSGTPAAAVVQWVALLSLSLAVGLLMWRSIPKHWANPMLSVAALGAVALVGEGAARFKAVVSPATQGFPTYSTAFWARRHVRLDRDGFRLPAGTQAPEPGARRLVLMGDSYAFGVGIARTEERFGERLVSGLNAATNARWELVNLSRSDQDTQQELQVLRAAIPRIEPGPNDVVMLLYVFNDIDYLAPVIERTALTEVPHGVLGRLNIERLLFVNSFLFQELYVRWRHAGFRLGYGGMARDPYADTMLVARHLRDVCALVELAEKNGSVAAVVPFDVATVLSPTYAARMDGFTRQAEDEGIPVWRVDQAFAGRPYAALTINSLDGHPNELANRLAAEALLPRLLASISSRAHPREPDCRASNP